MKDSIFDIQRFDDETATWATIQTAGESTAIGVDTTIVSGTDSDDVITTATIESDTTARQINGNGGNDNISNVLSFVSVIAGDGNDSIANTDNNASYINAGDGNNSITNSLAYEIVTVNGAEKLNNYYSDTTIISGSGNDIVNNVGGFNVSIATGDGIDIVYSNHSYYNTIDAGAGNDMVEITKGHYQNVLLGDGDDILLGETITGSWALGGYATVDGGAGDDILYTGYTNNSSIIGGEGNDTIVTSGINSFFDGGAGDDSISAADSLEGSSLIGGDGNDTISVTNSSQVFVDAGDGDNFISSNFKYEIVTIGGVETLANYYSDTSIVAGAGNDTVSVVGGFNVSIATDDGDDYIFSRHSYYNTIDAGAGNDTIDITEGDHQYIIGGDGDDSIFGEKINGEWVMGDYATIDAGADNDYIGANDSSYSSISGGAGSDTIISSGSNVTIDGGAGDDVIELSAKNSTVTGGEGNDSISVTESVTGATITGGAGTDTINNSGKGNVFVYNSGDGTDIVIGLTASDTLIVEGTTYSTVVSESGEDLHIIAGEGTVYLQGAAEVPPVILGTLQTAEGNLVITNATADTLINGSSGNDSITNSGANVTINGGAGDDTLTSSADSTTFVYNTGDGSDVISGFKTGDSLIVDGELKEVTGNGAIEVGTGSITIQDYTIYNSISNTTVSGTSGADIIENTAARVTVNANAGDDTISNSANNVQIFGDDGNDYIDGKGSSVTLSGGAGDDTLEYGKDAESFGSRVSISGGDGYDSINVYGGSGITINGGVGNDTVTKSITETNAIVYQYDGTGGNDVIIGLNASDTLVIDDSIRYTTVVSGDDQIVSIAGSESFITLKDAAGITPNFVGMYFYGNKSGATVDNPVAQIDGTEYFYAAISDAVNDADAGGTVNVIANSTESAVISSSKDVSLKFTESGLSVYSVSGGNFTASTSTAQFTVNNGKSVTSGGNTLAIRENATTTFNGYSIRGGETSQTFTLQDGAFATINGAAYSGNATATFSSTGKASVTSGAIISDTNLVASTTGIALATGNYEINGVQVTATSVIDAYSISNGVKFNLTSDTSVTYGEMNFTGSTIEIYSDSAVTLTNGAAVTNVPEGSSFTLSGKGTYKLNNKTIVSSATSLTVTNTAEGLTIGSNIFRVTGDDAYTLNVDADGNISSAAGIDGGSTIISAGGASSILTSSTGNFTFESEESEKTFAIGDDDSVTFSLTNSGVVQGIANLIGTASGSFSDAVKINDNALDLWITGDDAVTLTVDSLGAAVISGVSNGASVKSTGGALKVTTDEEGEFVFRQDIVQPFTVTGDSSVDFIIGEYKLADGNATMQVEGINNFENGYYAFNSDTEYHGFNIGETIYGSDEMHIYFRHSDTANFVISDSKIVHVSGVELSIDNLVSDVTVQATGAMTVNGANIDVTGDEDYNVIVESGTVKAVTNISAGATVNVNNLNVTTDNDGEFKIGDTTFKVINEEGNASFETDGKGTVKNVNLNGDISSSANNLTVNGAAIYTSNTDATISSVSSNILAINGLSTDDTVSGDIDSAIISMPGSTESDTSRLTINGIGYTLDNDTDGVIFDGYQSGARVIDDLSGGASLRVGAAGTYSVNATPLEARIGDIIVGTAEYSAYIYDPSKSPLNVGTMEDDEIVSQAGITNSYVVDETNTMLGNVMLETGGTSLEGSMAIAIDNNGAITPQLADFRAYTGSKRVTLAGGEQNLMFNNEGKNVAVLAAASEGERNVTLGSGDDLAIVREIESPVNITAGQGKDTVLTAGNDVWVNLTGGATKIMPNSGNVTINGYEATTGAGIQADYTSIPRAVLTGNIGLGDGEISLGSSNVVLTGQTGNSSTVNFYNNLGEMQKVMYAHTSGATMNTSADKANWLLVGNYSLDKSNVSQIIGGSGNDSAFGGAGDFFNLGGGQNHIIIKSDDAYTASSTIVMSDAQGDTYVEGFKGGFANDSDRIIGDFSKLDVSYKNGQLILKSVNSSLVLNNVASAADLAESADLIADTNLVNDENILAAITPVTYEQGEYNPSAQWSVASGQLSVVSSQWSEKNN